MWTADIFLTCGYKLLHYFSVAIGAKKLLVDHIITACVKEMSPGCCMQSFKQKSILLSLKVFAINRILNFVFWVT